MNQNKTMLVGVGALIIGVIIGFGFGGRNIEKRMGYGNEKGAHMMQNGQMMNNGNTSMSGMMMDMNAALRGKTGDEFDKVFLSEMIVHHEGAVQMAQLALQNAKHQEIKDLAQAIITAQNIEIAQMKGWNSAWYTQ